MRFLLSVLLCIFSPKTAAHVLELPYLDEEVDHVASTGGE